ncbi:MAG: tetratricopeptide repeat protein [Deltaproteobacteria bacterium]|nr:tetratricopeptide repeat protein [Deltaproteobacteria bacterium]
MRNKNPVQTYRALLICVLLVASVLVIYWPVQHFEFVDCDDTIYVTENRHIQRGMNLENLHWALTATETANWHPLTWWSLMLDHTFYGLNAGGFHRTNVVFHMVSVLFLFLLMRRMTGEPGKSAFVTLVFALHPLNVESVAWVSERKNVLSAFLWIMTMWAYVSYVERPVFHRYLLVLLLFVFGLMAKPVLVTLPFVLLLIDYWPLRRFAPGAPANHNNVLIGETERKSTEVLPLFRLIWEKTPFFCIAALSSVVTIYAANRGNALKSFDQFPLEGRIANVFMSYVEYLGEMFWPGNLAFFYPYRSEVSALQFWWSTGLFLGVTFYVLWMAKKYRYLPVGWLWYVGTMFPTIGVIQVGYQSMADRYAYIPLIGIFIIIAWGVPDLLSRMRHRRAVLAIASCCVIVALTISSHSQVQHWRDSRSVFQHALNVTTGNHMAYNGMGNVYLHNGDLKSALVHYLEALRLRPDYAEARNNVGIVYIKQGRNEDAIEQFRLAIKAKPDFAKTYNNMGIALALQGKTDDAIIQFRAALKIDPEYERAKHNLSVTLGRKRE